MILNKPVILEKLQSELNAAGIPTPRGLLTRQALDGAWSIWRGDADGHIEDLPPEALVILNAHDGTPPTPINFGADALGNRQAITTTLQNIRAYQALAANAVTQAQRKAYEDLIGDAIAALARRSVG